MNTEQLFLAVWARPEIVGLSEGQKVGVRHFQVAYESNEQRHPDLEPHEQNSATLEYLLLHSGITDSTIPAGVSIEEFLDGIVAAFDAASLFVGNTID